MKYEAHLEEEIFKYCNIAGIILINGTVPKEKTDEINRFINYKTRADRIKTRAIEELNAFTMTHKVKLEIQEKVESPIEEFMLTAITQHGLDKHCRTQFQIGTKRVDFAFPIAKLVVECDGKEYHYSDREQIERDQKRDEYLAKKGWRIKHFDGLIIRRNINLCIEYIKNQLEPFIQLSKG